MVDCGDARNLIRRDRTVRLVRDNRDDRAIEPIIIESATQLCIMGRIGHVEDRNPDAVEVVSFDDCRMV
jgi:hypothetical protein